MGQVEGSLEHASRPGPHLFGLPVRVGLAFTLPFLPMSVAWINCSQICTDASEQGWLLREIEGAQVFTNVYSKGAGAPAKGYQFEFLYPPTQKLVKGAAHADRRQALHLACVAVERFLS